MRWWWQRRNREADWERELLSHIEAEAEEQGDQCLTGEEADYAARRAFGNVTAVKEDVREAWDGPDSSN
jgi:hypothetical protein